MTKKLTLERFLRELERKPLAISEISDTRGLPADFKPTTAFNLIIERLDYAREVRAPLALITGSHGAGKTTALRYYAYSQDVLMWECPPRYHEKWLMKDLAKRLGISAGVSWGEQSSIVAEQLAAAPRTFLLDEAQRLNYAGMDVLKFIADASGSTFVVSASPSLEKRIDRWDDISSRCTVRVRVKAVSAEEFLRLYKDEGFRDEALLELHKLSNGVMRTIKAMLREIDLQLAAYSEQYEKTTRDNLTPELIRIFAERVTG